MQILLDSNILIRWLEPSDRDQVVVEAALDRLTTAKVELCYTSQNLGEFWNAMTRPADRNGYGLSPQEANRRAIAMESRLELLPDSVATHKEWRELLVSHR